MKNRKLFGLLAMAVALPQLLNSQTQQLRDCHYVYFANGNVQAFPKEYVKEQNNADGMCRITLVNDSIIEWNASEIDSISAVSPEFPRFASFGLNDDYNDQLFSKVKATITDNRVTAAVGAIGKWLTPTFELDSSDGIAYVGGNRQRSEASRLRFAEPVIYTLSREGYQRLALEPGSDGGTADKSDYAFCMMPLGREVTVEIDWLTDRAESVPRIDINIDGGEMVSSKDYYLNALIKIQGYGVWPDFEDSVQIKGRGNTSWNEGKPYAKNPYRLKFGSSVKPFGMKKGKNWNLIAQAQKGSMMTNAIAMKAARMVGAAAANDIIPVELYMNGDYRGSYIFTQKVGLANNSVDIDESAAALLELDHYYDETYKFKSAKFALPVNIKDPDFSEGETMLTFEQVQEDFNIFESAVYNNSNFERLIDMEMLTRFMLVNELVLNSELGHPKSVYLYRENLNHIASPYTFGPVWDFDWSYDYETSRTYCTGGETNSILNYQTSRPGCKFFTKLWNLSPWVKHEYGRLWKRFMENHLQELIDYVDDYYAFANSSFQNNATKWNDGSNYDSNVVNMKRWLQARALHLASIYPCSSTDTPYSFGDVDKDGKITETDLQNLIGHFIEGTQTDTEKADIDANGVVSVSDVAWLCNLIQRYPDSGVQQSVEIPQSSVVWQENSKDHIVISLNDGATPGTWQLTAAMENVNSYLAFSMIINLPEGITVSHAENSERMPSHFLRYSGVKESGSEGESQSTSNSSTLIAYSPQNSYIDGNSGTLFTLTLTAHNMGEGSYPIKLTDIRMVTGNGKEQSLASAETVLNISDTSISNINTEPVETTYFTLDGKQLHQPLPGITICRKVYPDGRVVVELKK